ncbi:hypothetical protein E2C01_014057 [Portunus trituberculatus]|uniref:Uncharacterized protein n=1 Tax=Portunus trituberculatus TaxID=210409 RepID=A0A5B7DIV8_PORTR|nr:hypothetical protein [Portunus trituberculatus]
MLRKRVCGRTGRDGAVLEPCFALRLLAEGKLCPLFLGHEGNGDFRCQCPEGLPGSGFLRVVWDTPVSPGRCGWERQM